MKKDYCAPKIVIVDYMVNEYLSYISGPSETDSGWSEGWH